MLVRDASRPKPGHGVFQWLGLANSGERQARGVFNLCCLVLNINKPA